MLDTVLLLALPASGKSEVRRYLRRLPQESCVRDFHLNPTVQLDDFPYVHMMRRIDEELETAGHKRIFYHGPNDGFQNPWDWGTLIHLLNDDYQELSENSKAAPSAARNMPPAAKFFARLDRAAVEAGIPGRLKNLAADVSLKIASRLDNEVEEMTFKRSQSVSSGLNGKTLIIEFARGGPQGAKVPLPAPLGYRYSISRLSKAILEKAVILYVWVTPEASFKKNRERADHTNPGSILHHSVPDSVMKNDYGCDDMDWLEANSERPGTATIVRMSRNYYIPTERFDNRDDKTTFLRADPKDWKPADIGRVHNGLKKAFGRLVARESGI